MYGNENLDCEEGISKQEDVICEGINVHLRVGLYYDWIIENTVDATYCRHPFWRKTQQNQHQTNTYDKTRATSPTHYGTTMAVDTTTLSNSSGKMDMCFIAIVIFLILSVKTVIF